MSAHEITTHGDVRVMHCRGRIVARELEPLRDAARSAVNETGRLIFDLGGVKFIDSTGLGMLAVLCVSARKRSGDVKLVAPSPELREVLEVTMLGRIFEVFPTVEEALAAFAKSVRATK
jgi:anti-sigma B factor antagonist